MRIIDWSSDVCSSDLLKAARLDSKIGTQADVAAALSRAMGETIEPSAIGNYEQGTRLPDPITIQHLCSLYQASPSATYVFDDAPESKEEAALLLKYSMTDARGRRPRKSVVSGKSGSGRVDI